MSAAVQPWLEDHRLDGATVVAGATHLSLALSAAHEVLGGAAARLQDVEFPEMLVLGNDEWRTVHAAFAPGENGTTDFRIHSGSGGDDPDWKLHASGTLLAAGPPDPAPDLAAIQARCPQAVPAGEMYEQLWDAGYHLGDTFRWIEEIRRGEGEVLCRMRLPQPRDEAERYRIPPGLLDSCFQLVGASLGADEIARLVDEEIFMVPVGVGALQLHAPARGGLWCHAVVQDSASADELAAGVHLFDDAGQTVVSIERFRARRVSRKAVGKRKAESAAEWLYALRWRRQDSVPERARQPAVPSAAGWMVLSDRGGVGRALAALLESRGEDCHLVEFEHSTSPEFFRQRLRPSRGIVYLWPLDAPAEPSSDDDPALIGALHLVQALAQTGWRDAPRLFFVTRGAQAAADGEPIALAPTPLWGLGRTIALEHPELACTRIDLSRQAAEAEIPALAGELLLNSREDQVLLRGGERYVARLARAPAPALRQASLLRSDAVYLVTGGLGGVGLTVARWLIEQGARHLALVGRSARDEAALELRALGAEVIVIQADAANERQLRDALEQIDKVMPPLAGVIHAAAVLDDGILLQMTGERFRTAMAPKVSGAWNLHKLTAGRPLDFFVLFSSLASLMGSPGQGNYAAGNAFLDGLAHYRRAQGLPGLSINWGPWAEVGQAAAEAKRGKRLALRGVASIQPELGLEALGLLLGSEYVQAGVMGFNLRQWREFFPAAANAPLLSELRDEQPGLKESRPPGYMRPVFFAAKPEERRPLLLSHLQEQVGQVLRMNPAEIDPNVALGSLGLDSLMGLEIRNRLEASLGLTLSATLAWTYPTLAALTVHLAERMDLPLEEPRAEPGAESDRLAQIAGDIAHLSESEMEALLMKKLEDKDNSSTFD